MSKEKTYKCELCGEDTEILIGCAQCGKLIGPCCEAADEDDSDESICEACF